MLRVGGEYCHRGQVVAQGERPGSQASDLPSTKPGLNGKLVEHRSVAAGEPPSDDAVAVATEELLSLPSGFDELLKLGLGERASLVATIDASVEDVQVGEGRGQSAPVLYHPAAERLQGAQVVVECLGTDPRHDCVALLGGLPKVIKERLDLARRDVVPVDE